MAQPNVDPDLALLREVGGPINITPDLQLVPSQPFEDGVVTNARQYRFEGDHLDVTALTGAINRLAPIILNGAITPDMGKLLLILALHVRAPEEAVVLPLWDFVKTAGDNYVLFNVQELVPAQGNEEAQQPSTSQDPPPTGPKTQPKPDPKKYKTRADYEKALIMYADYLAGKSGGGSSVPEVVAGEDNVRFWTFMSAWAMRLCSKAPLNLRNSYARMVEQYKKFNPSRPCPEITPHERAWENLKRDIDGSPLIKNTWISVISLSETDERHEVSKGMLRYLAYLPLSFTGMHAYALFLDLLKSSGADPTWMVSKMVIPPTIKALRQIREILMTKERRAGPTNDNFQYTTHYKYARLIGPQYYQELQTKNAVSLVYLIATLLPKFNNYGDGPNGPQAIVALVPLGDAQKELLDAIADEIYDQLNRTTFGNVSSTARDAKAKLDARREAARIPDQEAQRRLEALQALQARRARGEA